MIKLAIIDDHQLFSQGVTNLLKEVKNILLDKSFSSYSQFQETEKLADYDIILLDINLENENGLDVCEKIKKENEQIKIIALTMINEFSVIRKMINNGADGYLLKNVDKEELISAIETVHSGKHYFGKSTMKLLSHNTTMKSESHTTHKIPVLSRREKEVLTLIIDEYTTQEIADSLGIKFSTVETHRRNLSIKLGARNIAGLVRIAIENDLF